MPTETANPAKGTLLKLGLPYSAASYSSIALIVSIDGPSREVGTRETTTLVSSAKTFAPTIFDGGEVSGKLLYDPKGGTQVSLETLLTTPSLAKWQMVFADTNGPTTGAFDGVLTKLGPTGIEVESNLEAEFTIKVSGAVTLT